MLRTKLISFARSVPFLAALLTSIKSRYYNTFSVSNNYSALNPSDHNKIDRLSSSWKNKKLPVEQRKLVDHQLQLYKQGNSIDVFDIFVDSVNSLPNLRPHSLLLEIGCSSGYYSEICEFANLPIKYTGCDYSDSFVELAQSIYPSIDFKVCDATSLEYEDKSFDIVVSGCCLLHIPNYIKAVQESVRVASSYVIFHRTPVVLGAKDQWYKKNAYGVETVEIHFNENGFISLLKEQGLSLIKTYTISEDLSATNSFGRAVRTYVCQRVGH